MKQQLDLLARGSLRIKPAPGRAEPRVWVKRLAIWSEPGNLIREIPLRPGLNIVWSPDPLDRGRSKGDDDGIGHGSGKTLFCRLLRYCLGEDRFAPDHLRDAIASSFENGLVGAEVIVDSASWAIVRAIGLSRTNVAVKGGDLTALAGNPPTSTGLAAFLAEIESSVISEEVAELVAGGRPGFAWLTALAWLSRDQECRFDNPLAWRAKASASGSPDRALSDGERVEVIRALLGALAPAEQEVRREVERLDGERKAIESLRGRREWGVHQHLSRLAGALSTPEEEVPAGSLATDYLRSKAREKLASIVVVRPEAGEGDPVALRAAYDDARARHKDLAVKLAKVEGAIPELKQLASKIQGELSTSAFERLGVVCPVCEVPIDRALAEGCKLSHNLPDQEELRRRWEGLKAALKEEQGRLSAAEREQAELEPLLEESAKFAEGLRERLEATERIRDARGREWFLAQRNLEDVDLYETLRHEAEESAAAVARMQVRIDKARESIAGHRESRAKAVRHLSRLFDAIVRVLVGESASGKLTVDGNGLQLGIELGGDRSTAAIDSLKVLAFDVAALCMSIEGGAHLPAFLLHDSPREADLGKSLYYRVFEFMRELEAVGGKPLFQYIVTTTTQPPPDLCKDPWLRLKLEGTPADDRLLRKDL